ncbi:hypothetical protein CHH27_13265 [Labrenzia sp. VG12]|nr:hypothetical protein CHH27_13265 [Labrenzia sp. VG12]
MIVMTVVSIVLEIFTGISINGVMSQLVAVMGAATDAGHRFYKNFEIVPDSGFAWSASFQMTLVEGAISLTLGGLFVLFLLASGELGSDLGSFLLFTLLLTIALLAISWVAKRFMFVSGARQAEKVHLAKQAKRSAVFE